MGDENSDDKGDDVEKSFYYAPTDLEAIGEKPIVEKSVGYHKLDCHDHLCFI